MGARISGSVAGIPYVGLCARIEVEGLLVWLDGIDPGFPALQPTFEEFDPQETMARAPCKIARRVFSLGHVQ
jgi:hypothetical protein